MITIKSLFKYKKDQNWKLFRSLKFGTLKNKFSDSKLSRKITNNNGQNNFNDEHQQSTSRFKLDELTMISNVFEKKIDFKSLKIMNQNKMNNDWKLNFRNDNSSTNLANLSFSSFGQNYFHYFSTNTKQTNMNSQQQQTQTPIISPKFSFVRSIFTLFSSFGMTQYQTKLGVMYLTGICYFYIMFVIYVYVLFFF